MLSRRWRRSARLAGDERDIVGHGAARGEDRAGRDTDGHAHGHALQFGRVGDLGGRKTCSIVPPNTGRYRTR